MHPEHSGAHWVRVIQHSPLIPTSIEDHSNGSWYIAAFAKRSRTIHRQHCHRLHWSHSGHFGSTRPTFESLQNWRPDALYIALAGSRALIHTSLNPRASVSAIHGKHPFNISTKTSHFAFALLKFIPGSLVASLRAFGIHPQDNLRVGLQGIGDPDDGVSSRCQWLGSRAAAGTFPGIFHIRHFAVIFFIQLIPKWNSHAAVHRHSIGSGAPSCVPPSAISPVLCRAAWMGIPLNCLIQAQEDLGRGHAHWIIQGHSQDVHGVSRLRPNCSVASIRVSCLEGRDVVSELTITVIRQFHLILPGSRSGIRPSAASLCNRPSEDDESNRLIAFHLACRHSDWPLDVLSNCHSAGRKGSGSSPRSHSRTSHSPSSVQDTPSRTVSYTLTRLRVRFSFAQAGVFHSMCQLLGVQHSFGLCRCHCKPASLHHHCIGSFWVTLFPVKTF